MASILTRARSNVSISVSLDDDEVFDFTERWGARRTFRIRSLRATGDPQTGRLDRSVRVLGANVKKDGTEGLQRTSYCTTQFKDLTGSVQAQIAEAFAKACRDFADEVQNAAFVATQFAEEVVA